MIKRRGAGAPRKAPARDLWTTKRGKPSAQTPLGVARKRLEQHETGKKLETDGNFSGSGIRARSRLGWCASRGGNRVRILWRNEKDCKLVTGSCNVGKRIIGRKKNVVGKKKGEAGAH